MGIHLYAIRLRIALLICDTPLPVVVEKYGDYEKLFGELLRQGAAAYSASTKPVNLEIEAFNVVEGQYPVDISNFSAFVLTGSKYSAYEDLDWINKLKRFMQRVDAESTAKVVGVCFGHQIVAEALGGKVVKNPAGWEVGWTPTTLTPLGETTLRTGMKVHNVHQMHQDHVSVLPPGFKVLASTDKCPIQMAVRGDRYLTIQGHPEFTAGVVTEIVKARQASNVFAPDMASTVLSRVDNAVDNSWFGKKMVGFMVGTIDSKEEA
ncbi:class I glutamine amidotransferase-like protein [Geranomyces variabilis]|nr:class I glutamine amidotransferase-like protein [Geranomyces variabilis]KAJ3136711.1 hypothetical protein HDU90_003088 [Geranomyces variabilis]